MKFIHLSDLHLGKRVNGYSMLEDQEYILNEIKAVITAEAPDAVLITPETSTTNRFRLRKPSACLTIFLYSSPGGDSRYL